MIDREKLIKTMTPYVEVFSFFYDLLVVFYIFYPRELPHRGLIGGIALFVLVLGTYTQYRDRNKE